LTKTETQRPEAEHHKWLMILNVSWKDMVRNESIREQTGQEKFSPGTSVEMAGARAADE